MVQSAVGMANLYVFNETRTAAVYGIGSYIRELTAALKKTDIKVYVLHLHSGKPDMEMEVIEDIQHWYIPAGPVTLYNNHNNNKQYERYYLNVLYLLQLYILKSDNKEELIFHLNYFQCIPLANALKSVFDCKTVFVVHYLDSVVNLLGNISRLRRIFSQPNESKNEEEKSAKKCFLQEKELLQSHSIDKIICLSNHAFDLLHQDYKIEKEKMDVIYNGLSDSLPVSNKHTLRMKYHIPYNPIILFVGRLNYIKGLTYLLQAFKTVLSTYPNSRMIVAGSGEFDLHMKECEDICMNITWTGLLGKDKLYELYSIADIGVVPSLFEPFGYVAVEMMMHELPIVATATSGLNEVVDDCCGLKIPIIEHSDRIEIDSNLLAEKIIYLLEHPDKARKMGQNGRKRYLSEYSSEVFRRNMLNFYTSLYET